MKDVHFDLHGLSVSIATDTPELSAFVKAHFEAARGATQQADIEVEASWRWGEQAVAETRRPSGAALAGQQKAGRGLLLAPRESGGIRARWNRVPDFPELTFELEMGGDLGTRLKLRAVCAYAPRGAIRTLEYMRPGRVQRKRDRLFFKLMYFMAYYPIAWKMERTRGWGLAHASAVTLPSGATAMLSGMGGVGKSTLAMALLSHPGARLLSDNLLLHDDERIYAMPEPLRLDESAVAGVGEEGVELARSKLPLTAHPKPTWTVGAARTIPAATPTALFFLRFGSQPAMIPIDPDKASQLLSCGNDLAREIKDYRPCSALLSMIAAESGAIPAAPRAAMARLVSTARCYIVTIGAGESIAATAGRLSRTAEGRQ